MIAQFLPPASDQKQRGPPPASSSCAARLVTPGEQGGGSGRGGGTAARAKGTTRRRRRARAASCRCSRRMPPPLRARVETAGRYSSRSTARRYSSRSSSNGVRPPLPRGQLGAVAPRFTTRKSMGAAWRGCNMTRVSLRAVGGWARPPRAHARAPTNLECRSCGDALGGHIGEHAPEQVLALQAQSGDDGRNAAGLPARKLVLRRACVGGARSRHGGGGGGGGPTGGSRAGSVRLPPRLVIWQV